MWLVALGFIGAGILNICRGARLLHQAGLNIQVHKLRQIIEEELPKRRASVTTSNQELLKEVEEGELRIIGQLWGRLKYLYEQGGQPGEVGNMEQVLATGKIAWAAAFFAIASIVVGISAILVTFFSV